MYYYVFLSVCSSTIYCKINSSFVRYHRMSFISTSCHQLCTEVLSFLPYTTGKQQLDEEMPQIRHFHFINRYQRDSYICDGRICKERWNVYIPSALFVYSCHHRMTEMTELQRSESEVHFSHRRYNKDGICELHPWIRSNPYGSLFLLNKFKKVLYISFRAYDNVKIGTPITNK